MNVKKLPKITRNYIYLISFISHCPPHRGVDSSGNLDLAGLDYNFFLERERG